MKIILWIFSFILIFFLFIKVTVFSANADSGVCGGNTTVTSTGPVYSGCNPQYQWLCVNAISRSATAACTHSSAVPDGTCTLASDCSGGYTFFTQCRNATAPNSCDLTGSTVLTSSSGCTCSTPAATNTPTPTATDTPPPVNTATPTPTPACANTYSICDYANQACKNVTACSNPGGVSCSSYGTDCVVAPTDTPTPSITATLTPTPTGTTCNGWCDPNGVCANATHISSGDPYCQSSGQGICCKNVVVSTPPSQASCKVTDTGGIKWTVGGSASLSIYKNYNSNSIVYRDSGSTGATVPNDNSNNNTSYSVPVNPGDTLSNDFDTGTASCTIPVTTLQVNILDETSKNGIPPNINYPFTVKDSANKPVPVNYSQGVPFNVTATQNYTISLPSQNNGYTVITPGNQGGYRSASSNPQNASVALGAYTYPGRTSTIPNGAKTNNTIITFYVAKPTHTLTTRVFNDDQNDCIDHPSNGGYLNQTVKVDNILSKTNSTGYAKFSNITQSPPGTHSVQLVTIPSGYEISPNCQQSVTLTNFTSDTQVNFGLIPIPAAKFNISGHVYVDPNHNQINYPGEPTFPGVNVTISSNPPVTTRTDNTGLYSVKVDSASTYTVTLDNITGYVIETQNPATISNISSDQTQDFYIYQIACDAPCSYSGSSDICTGGGFNKDGCTTCKSVANTPTNSMGGVCAPPACGNLCANNSDCAGSTTDGCTTCDTVSHKCSAPTCNSSCDISSNTANSCHSASSNGSVTCSTCKANSSDPLGGSCAAPACGNKCTNDSDCSGATGKCSTCDSTTHQCILPACGSGCSYNSYSSTDPHTCVGASGGCSTCKSSTSDPLGGVCAAPACGNKCTSSSDCAGAGAPGGDGCTTCVGSGNSATCQTVAPAWVQTIGSDIRNDQQFINPMAQDQFASLPGSGKTPGIIFSGLKGADLGKGNASPYPYSWQVSNEIFNTKESPLPLSYKNIYTQTAASGSLGDLSSSCDNGSFTPCTLSLSFSNGAYIANSSLTLQAHTFSGFKNYVILVNGNLTIAGPLTVTPGSTLVILASQDIHITPNVDKIEGFYAADNNVIVDKNPNADCNPTTDIQLHVAGMLVANAGRSTNANNFVQNRTLCQNNSSTPAVQVSERPDLILNAPRFLKTQNVIWQETAP